jgi:hypothetical protein
MKFNIGDLIDCGEYNGAAYISNITTLKEGCFENGLPVILYNITLHYMLYDQKMVRSLGTLEKAIEAGAATLYSVNLESCDNK